MTKERVERHKSLTKNYEQGEGNDVTRTFFNMVLAGLVNNTEFLKNVTKDYLKGNTAIDYHFFNSKSELFDFTFKNSPNFKHITLKKSTPFEEEDSVKVFILDLINEKLEISSAYINFSVKYFENGVTKFQNSVGAIKAGLVLLEDSELIPTINLPLYIQNVSTFPTIPQEPKPQA